MNKKLIALLVLTSNLAIAQESDVHPFAQPFEDPDIPKKEVPQIPKVPNEKPKEEVTEVPQATPHLNRELADKILKPGIRNINYSLKILKDEKVIYDSAFSLLNSEIVPVIAVQDENTKKDSTEDSTKSNLSEDLQGEAKASEASKTKVSLIRVVVFLDKKNKNMWSNFFIENGESNNAENGKFGILNKGDKSVQLLNTIKTPSTEYDKKEVLISHISGRNSEASLENYKFIFNGKLIK